MITKAIGWMLATIDRLRAGEERLPPANFSYLGRGFELFVVFLVYGLGVLIVAAITRWPALRSRSGTSIHPITYRL